MGFNSGFKGLNVMPNANTQVELLCPGNMLTCFRTVGIRLILFLYIEKRTCKYFFLNGNSFEWHKMLLETRF